MPLNLKKYAKNDEKINRIFNSGNESQILKEIHNFKLPSFNKYKSYKVNKN